MQVLTAAEMRACDRRTTDPHGIPPGRLMRAASEAAVRFLHERYPAARRFTILAGGGKNGGDGLHIARLLAVAGAQVTVFLLASPDALKEETAEAWRLLTANVNLVAHHVIHSADEFGHHTSALRHALHTDLIVDAIVGTGYDPPLRELPVAVLKLLLEAESADARTPVVAIDLPSGWVADSTTSVAPGPVFPADAVITFTAPKPAHVFGQLTRHWHQPIVIASIGSPPETVTSSGGLQWAGAAKALVEMPRAADANKGHFGHVLVVGGSAGKSGAPAMTALAALRAGAGLVTAAVPAPIHSLVAAAAHEIMTIPLAAHNGAIARQHFRPGARITTLAVGPGLGTSPLAADFALQLIESSRHPAVLDADGLNALAAAPERLPRIAAGRALVLTPHPGEMARLTGMTITEVQANRLAVTRDFAVRHGVTVVLKGRRTLIAHPSGAVAINTSGNPAMAKAGSGDLLTGMIAALLAQHPLTPALAVEAAVYLHGLAADLALASFDQHTLLATDTLSWFSSAFRYQPHTRSGYCWLQGISPEAKASSERLLAG